MSIVAVIPARGGSKGIPRKNLMQIAGRPLIAYAIEVARNADSVDRVLISTDDSEIADVARELGAEVPFLRPPELAEDTAPMLGVLSHALAWLESQDVAVEALVLLQPTSPLRTGQHVEEAIALFRSAPASSVVSVVEVPHQFNPVSVMKLSAQRTLAPFLEDQVIATRRQDKPKAYARNGPVVLVCHPDTLRSGELYGERCVPYLMSEKDSLDIDTPEDLTLAEQVLLDRRR
ncbi:MULTISPECIES: cytidylyltransferase domain-containing protein [unclassified Haematospirillum]|uniref:acylneuraminate cytidylyltransferase family protein n=1 Tax=unclassified Haematospirillum TaxID=2622088 RepID=UPI0014391B7E|nr:MULTISPECIES: acylneuraminate cytidylyltransferase family protein [unclassified Haematospirillum]NKD56037.1 acylneuraminate cytidylyltransferase family protein [Haematospirillum sp. H4890]NKD76040.1 acylneuraminate cytidylyltransferase family protein [Haematospirillum sp. H4485]NKD88710.1 acylneuraminate cytidylyltransferase family protein [Haematospirillum sp. 15-248]